MPKKAASNKPTKKATKKAATKKTTKKDDPIHQPVKPDPNPNAAQIQQEDPIDQPAKPGPNPNAAQIQQEDNMKDQEVKFFLYSKTYCFLHFLFFQNPISRIHSTFGAFTAIQLNGMWNLDISNFADIHQTL